MIPPMSLYINISGSNKFKLWLPLFLIYPLMIIFGLMALPVILFLFLTIRVKPNKKINKGMSKLKRKLGKHIKKVKISPKNIIKILFQLYVMASSLKGTIIEVDDSEQKVLIKIN